MERELYDRGLEKALQGDLKGAIQDFDQALQINPQFAEAYYKRGVTRFDLGDNLGAIEDYTQALQINTESIENYFGRSLAHLAQGDTQGAIEDFEAFIAQTDDKKQKSQRQRWVKDLRAGKNSFTDEELKKL